jgi:hypothetical protein
MIGRGLGVAAGVVVALAVAAPSASAETFPVVFSYENGTVQPPWQAIQAPAGRMSVAASPTDPTKNVMRVELRNGDVFVTGGVGYNRAEVYARHGNVNDYSAWPDGDNTERWYGWSTYFEPGFPAVSNWASIVQWHSMAGGTPPLSINTQYGYVELNHYGAETWRSATPVQTGTWHTFVAHVKWSAVEALGFVELWHNGVQVVPKTAMATEQCCAVQGVFVRPYPNFLKMGIYRDPNTVPTAVLYDGPMRVGLDRQSVEPAPGG